MSKLLKASIGLLALVAASSAVAQDVVDPIGSLLDQIDEETAESQGAAPPVPPAPTPPATSASPAQSTFPYATVSPSAPSYAPPAPTPPSYVSRRPQLSAPVNVDDYDRTPEAPLNSVEQNYENRLRASFASAQGMQGPMDGAWTLSSRDGGPLYALLLVDKNQATLEGAWRDTRRPGVADASGFFAAIQRIGGQINATFYPKAGGAAAALSLSAAAGGQWTGELEESGRRIPVTLKRD
mgnify:CR=1 FL=1